MTLNRRLWHLANLALLLTALLFGRLAYWQLVRGRALQPVVIDPVVAAEQYLGDAEVTGPITLERLPQPVIQRTVAALAQIQRGDIYDRHGQLLAYTVPTEGGAARVYAEPSLAHTVGYVSGLDTGVAGLEYAYNLTLLGLDRFDSQLARLAHQPIVGSDLYLTLDARTQQAAAQALGGRPGAVVVLEARTGAVLAMVSAPGFDPNHILDPDYANAVLAPCQGVPNCRGALLNRATQGLFTPGSTWKTVTLIAALETGLAEPGTVFDFGEPVQTPNGIYYEYRVGGGVIIDRTHTERQLTLQQSYAVSANAAFARLGDELGGETLLRYADRLGFSRDRGAPPIEIDAAAGQAANNPDDLVTNPLLRAAGAIGQGEVLASPLNMALLAAAVVNDGDVPRPHLLLQVTHPNGARLQGEPRGLWVRNAFRPGTAETVRALMIENVRSGGAGLAAVPGLTVGGKTGTAQLDGPVDPHAWFIGFAENDAHAVAIAVVVENGGSGATVAAPIFAQTAEAALRYLGEPPPEAASQP